MDGEAIPALLAASCSRSSLHPEAFAAVRAAFPECKLVRLSFGLQNKVMLSVTVNLEAEGLIHASYVPIHPTAAAAAVLQNNPVVVVRQDKRSPLWDQEDMYQREGCGTVNAVSMPFYWPPAANTQFEGAALPIPQNPAYHPTFGAMTVGSPRPLTQQSLALLVDLAGRTGRHVGPYISMLLSSLEAAGLLPSESEAQEELGSLLEEELQAAEDDGGPSMDELFTGDDAQGYVNTVTVSPDGSLCASGGKDGVAMLWDLSEGKRLYSLDASDIIHSLCFSPNRYWLCAATQGSIKIWDLESKSLVDELRPELPERSKKAQVPYCVCLAWSADGSTLYSGYTDGVIRVWQVGRAI